MMEGVSNEVCSLGGHWGLGKLICFYDDNEISIDGDTDIAFTEDVAKRYEALGWHVRRRPFPLAPPPRTAALKWRSAAGRAAAQDKLARGQAAQPVRVPVFGTVSDLLHRAPRTCSAARAAVGSRRGGRQHGH